jgi:hypothetical protein
MIPLYDVDSVRALVMEFYMKAWKSTVETLAS